MTSFAQSALLASALALALTACIEPTRPSPQRIACLNGCARDKDGCILHAMNAAAVAECDAASRACSEWCGR